MSKKKSTILRDGEVYHLFGNVIIEDKLPIGVYELKFGPKGEVALQKVDDIHMPDKAYSNDKNFIEHVLTEWETLKTGNLGVLMEGKKGLGKSFTANRIAKEAGVIVLKITHQVSNTVDLFGFLDKIEQDYVLQIDEFEKIFPDKYAYDDDGDRLDVGDKAIISQKDFLSYLDPGGVLKKIKTMFLFTANGNINQYLKNRPSRVRYYREYHKISDEVINEIISDLLVDEKFKQDLLENVDVKDLNVDVLIQIINEVNKHQKPYSSFKEFFNYKSEERVSYLVEIVDKDNNVLDVINESYSGSFYKNNNIGCDMEGNTVYIVAELSREQVEKNKTLDVFYVSCSIGYNSQDKVKVRFTLNNTKLSTLVF